MMGFNLGLILTRDIELIFQMKNKMQNFEGQNELKSASELNVGKISSSSFAFLTWLKKEREKKIF